MYAAYAYASWTSLEHFTSRIFGSLRRTDQRRWAHAYLNGLLVTPGKKSVRRLADAISSDPSVRQSLRQFVSLSPWDFDAVMEELTGWVAQHRTEAVWSIGRAVVRKRGDRSVGVHRYLDPSSGRTVNCQLALGSFLAVGGARVPVDWSLHLSPSWIEDRDRRRSTRIPDSQEYRPLWSQALRLVDRLSARTGASSAVVLAAMSDEPDVGRLLHGLTERRRDFVVAVPPDLAVLPVAESGVTGPAAARARVAGQAPENVVVPLPDGRQRVARLRTALVHLAGGRSPGPVYRVFAEADGEGAPGTVWLTSLTRGAVAEAASVADMNGETQAVIHSMERDFGLLDFEGRSFPGWHHHMALVSAAYAYRRLGRLTTASSRDAYGVAARHVPLPRASRSQGAPGGSRALPRR